MSRLVDSQRFSRSARKGRRKQAGSFIREAPADSPWLVTNVLKGDRHTTIIGDGGALMLLRQLAVTFAAGTAFGPLRPVKALRLVVATLDFDARDAYATEIERTGFEPAYRLHFYHPAFDETGLLYPNELARMARATGADAVIAESGHSAIADALQRLGDYSGGILSADCVSANRFLRVEEHDGDLLSLRTDNLELLTMRRHEGSSFVPISKPPALDLAARLSVAGKHSGSTTNEEQESGHEDQK